MYQAEYEAQVDRYDEEQETLREISRSAAPAQVAFEAMGAIAFLADRVCSGQSTDARKALLAIQEHAGRARRALEELGAQDFVQE